MALWKLSIAGAERFASGPAEEGPRELLAADVTIDAILAGPAGTFEEALRRGTGELVPAEARTLAPIGTQEIWAAGVTYRRSRDARTEESSEPDHYERIYNADRPELFFKSTATRARGPQDAIGIRADSTWNVPEPELGLALSSTGQIIGYLIGNDVSSRSIEGENPLYLPQAKCFTGSCAIGPCIVAAHDLPAIKAADIALLIRRDGVAIYEDKVSLTELRREPADLADWLYRSIEFPVGVFLLTGTGLIPPSEFTLEAGDIAEIAITGLGYLSNHVEIIGRTTSNVGQDAG